MNNRLSLSAMIAIKNRNYSEQQLRDYLTNNQFVVDEAIIRGLYPLPLSQPLLPSESSTSELGLPITDIPVPSASNVENLTIINTDVIEKARRRKQRTNKKTNKA
jgi:SOS response regulatory protein OraA/RecX